MRQLEHDHQEALFQWAFLQRNKYPELNLMFAIPNGGKRNITTAMKLKREGVKAGVLDIFLPVARKGYHGMFTEMKVKPNKPSTKQVEFIEKLTEQGYHCVVAYSFDEAKTAIIHYLLAKQDETT